MSEPQYMPFNANHHVRVKLTDYGRQVYREIMAKRWGARSAEHLATPAEDADGWSQWQLWDLMNTYGPFVGHGLRNVFDMNIEIEVQDA